MIWGSRLRSVVCCTYIPEGCLFTSVMSAESDHIPQTHPPFIAACMLKSFSSAHFSSPDDSTKAKLCFQNFTQFNESFNESTGFCEITDNWDCIKVQTIRVHIRPKVCKLCTFMKKLRKRFKSIKFLHLSRHESIQTVRPG